MPGSCPQEVYCHSACRDLRMAKKAILYIQYNGSHDLLLFPKVKICGITSPEDAMQAISFGADALGFQVGVRHKTEDEVSPEEAKAIVASLPPFVSYVMVTHLQDAKTLISLLELIQKTTTIQLHDEDIELKEMSAIREKIPSVRIIKTIHVDGSQAPLQNYITMMV